MRALRDPETLELLSVFTNELLKWALESICSITLDCRLGCLKPNLAADSEQRIMINCRNLKKFFRVLDTLNGKHIEQAKAKYEIMNNGTNLRDCSILEKLLRIDKVTAQVMTALDMLTVGIDTVNWQRVSGSLLYYIANNSEKQEKLREEVISVLPDKTSPVTQNVLNQKRYAMACIEESLRLFPIAIAILRTMQADVCIEEYKM
ncbi:Cytochrome P450 CYP12A2 [Trachymyrmex zeteki]|uniref:Cytochrome P450 CYP12A2 n=1 Tax=Mycetomoellerius zeteki TaxID=64791 RepID=A0A151WTH1_9HYME|nr:Cytochrome P450 CYP12A2 [Trachymyrmex zeteki]